MPLLFSYGTLQHEDVQRSVFGRSLNAQPDALVGFALSTFRVDDQGFASKSGKADHAIVTFTGRAENRVDGMVLEMTDAELAQADAYEPAGYKRVSTTLASGKQAWVYADARFS